MTGYERLGVLALVLVSGAVGSAGTIYLRPTPAEVVAIMPAPPRTVSWFTAHPDAIHPKQMACRDNPGSAAGDPECENSSQAAETMAADAFIQKAMK